MVGMSILRNVQDSEVEEVVAFTVPYLTPPSVNHSYKPIMYTGKDGYGHRGRKLSGEAKAFKEAVALFARGRTVAPISDSERRKVHYEVTVTIYLGPNQRLDADNGGKLALDGLVNAGVIHSDAYVSRCEMKVVKTERENPRTSFLVARVKGAAC
jgi:Holliday junction resolvase RusA-like endonuclease